MHYLLAVQVDESVPLPADEELEAMYARVGAVHEEMRAAGCWVFAGGLRPSDSAVHTDGPATDWPQVLALYDQLLALTPTPVVALNRAVALAEVHGPEAALAVVDTLDLPRYHLLPAVRADLLARLGRADEARAAYDDALALVGNDTERAFLLGRRDRLAR